MLELAAEPLFVLAQSQLRFGLRVAVEASANIAKAVTTLLLLKLQLASEVTSLCLAQVQHCISLSWLTCMALVWPTAIIIARAGIQVQMSSSVSPEARLTCVAVCQHASGQTPADWD